LRRWEQQRAEGKMRAAWSRSREDSPCAVLGIAGSNAGGGEARQIWVVREQWWVGAGIGDFYFFSSVDANGGDGDDAESVKCWSRDLYIYVELWVWIRGGTRGAEWLVGFCHSCPGLGRTAPNRTLPSEYRPK
jgi:hypothetical protein